MISEAERNKLQAECERLISHQKTLLLATVSQDGNTDISYAPYVREENTYYIFVSELAKHTHNLFKHSQASVLFIEDENQAANLFARRRLTLDCSAREIKKDDPIYNRQLLAMTEKFGQIVDVLRSLPDFHLFALTPNRGQFVAGFGKSLVVDANGCLQ